MQELENPFTTRKKKLLTPGGVSYWEWEETIYRTIMEMVLSRFKWTGLPEMKNYSNSLYMEKMLTEDGIAYIFEDSQIGYMMGTGTYSGLNHYNQPTHAQIVSPTYNKRYDLLSDKIVMVNNQSRGLSERKLVRRYARALAEIRMTQAINQNTLKTPYMLKADQKTKSSVERQLDELEQGSTRIFVDPALDKKNMGLDVVDLNAPYHVEKLQMQYMNLKQELLEIMGVNTNPQINKKERLTVGENESNTQEIGYYILSHLILRQEAAKQASELFGKEIKVEMSGYDDIADIFHGTDVAGLSDGGGSSVDDARSEIKGDESRAD